MRERSVSLEVQLLGDDEWLAAPDLCRLCRLELETLVELADFGVISPRGASPQDWQLPASALPRLTTAARLMHDLGVNASGVALALELLDVQRDLERQLRTLERLL